MGIVILITVIVIMLEAFIKMRYGYLFHKYLCDNYPDKRCLTIFDLKGEVNGFQTLKNLFNDSEKELDEEYLTHLKHKSRFWFIVCLVTMVVLPTAIVIIFVSLKYNA